MKFKDVYTAMIEYIKPDPRLLYDTLNGDKRKRKVYARNILKPALALVILLTLCLPSIFNFNSDIRQKDADNTPRGISHITNSEYYNGVIEKVLSIENFTFESGYEAILNSSVSDPLTLLLREESSEKIITVTLSKSLDIKSILTDAHTLNIDGTYVALSSDDFTEEEIKRIVNFLV